MKRTQKTADNTNIICQGFTHRAPAIKKIYKHIRTGAAWFSRAQMGGLSIFLAIVMLAVVIMTGLLVDIARVGAAKNQTARALDIATISALAGYETDLKNEYGLFAVNMPTPDTSALTDYIKKNLWIEADEGKFLGGLLETEKRAAHLYDYQIEQVELATQMPLSDADVIERQILEYMKYRAPVAMATGVAALIIQTRTASKMADSAKIKAEIDRKLAQIGKEQSNLRDYLYGDLNLTGTGDRYVLNFDKGNNRNDLADSIVSQYNAFVEASDEHYEAHESRARADGADREADKYEQNLIKEMKNDLQSLVDELIDREIRAFLTSNRGAAGCVEKIAKVSEELKPLYEKLDESVALLNEEELDTPFTEPLLEDTELGKESLIDAGTARGIIEQLNKNVGVVTAALNGLTELSREMYAYSPPGDPISQSALLRKLSPDVSGYNYDISYDYQKAPSTQRLPDPRELLDSRIADLIFKKAGADDKKLSDSGTDVSSLPSRNAPSWFAGLVALTSSYAGVGSGTEFGFNPFDTNSNFSIDALDSVADFGKILVGGLESIRNGLYVDEYILSMFTNSINDKYRWGGVAHPTKIAFFKAEVEYILHGNEKESSNEMWATIQLLMTRFALNYIHVITDTQKMGLARNTAIALATWWSAGAAVPAVTALIVAAWSMKEAITDTEDLLDGKKVPFIKLTGDWKNNIGVSAEGKPKSPEQLKWSYIDYLRIFLLQENRQKKLLRICDLIEINTKFAGRELKVKDLYCGLHSELKTSVNYLFMTAAFMPPQLKTQQNRHYLSAVSERDLF